MLQEGEGATSPKSSSVESREAISKAIMVATQEKSRVDGVLEATEEAYRAASAEIHRIRVDQDGIGKTLNEVSAEHSLCSNNLGQVSDKANALAKQMRKDKATLAKATSHLKATGDKTTQAKMKAAAARATQEVGQGARHRASKTLEVSMPCVILQPHL